VNFTRTFNSTSIQVTDKVIYTCHTNEVRSYKNELVVEKKHLVHKTQLLRVIGQLTSGDLHFKTCDRRTKTGNFRKFTKSKAWCLKGSCEKCVFAGVDDLVISDLCVYFVWMFNAGKLQY
jgi:hypothetical protein